MAHDPVSGEGARLHGGRFNRIGLAMLYLTSSIAGTFVEQSAGLPHRFDPLTVCSYDVDVDDIIDLRTPNDQQRANIALADMACGWKYDLANGRQPASWRIADRLISQKAAGILVPSFANGAGPDMFNLVLWRWGPDLPHPVVVFDPSQRLQRRP